MLIKHHLLPTAFREDCITVKAHDREVVELIAVHHMDRDGDPLFSDVVKESILQINRFRLSCHNYPSPSSEN